MTLIPELDRIRQEILASGDRATRLCQGLSGDELARRPEPDRWSIAENLIHLRATTELYLPSIDAALDDARLRGLLGEGPFRPGFTGRLMAWYMEPPVRFKSSAPKKVIPRIEGDVKQCLPRFLEAQESLIQRLSGANGIHLTKARLVSPLSSALRMDLLSTFRVLAAHERRHLFQAEQVRRDVVPLQNVA